ncbi:hypothetical protein GCM10011309_24650 [Litorimonas cladophorae]|uniref:DUF1905 domain-containing protein n=1 Tax=Litorimonas cladophorae TaxID=1220491 RepID=A0A918KRX6_9PROT|nr:DUF1905 domain-containing protein [Litorimonas cladophorae]GGX73639.1 hypothetical protein GCM10011309_24650 [Litorimonas cladophorae]
MIDLDFEFTAALWEWKGSWVFVTLPVEMSADIKHFTRHSARGFRSVRVKFRIGDTEWNTSLFPDKESGAYFLPIKKAIRKAEDLEIGDSVDVAISVAI